MADKIVNGLGFPVTRKITSNDYCDTLDGFLNRPVREQKRLAFKLYDFDDDGWKTVIPFRCTYDGAATSNTVVSIGTAA